MFKKNLLKSGWLHALFIAAIAYPITSMTVKVVSSYTDTNILVYTTFMMLSCSASLLIISGPGELSISTLKRPETWIYALLQIFSYILLLLSMKYISATEGAALGKMGGLCVFILSILFLNQRSNKYENIGAFVVFLGFYFIISSTSLPAESKAILTIIVIARALVQCGQKMITEVHKTNRKANSFKSQIRVTGFIMAISSFAFFMFLLIIAFFKTGNNISFFETFPVLTDFLNLQAFGLGLFLGALIISSSKYCEFYAGKTIGSKYLTSISSLELIFIFALEHALSKFNLIEPRAISRSTFIALALVFFGSIVISIAGFIKNMKFIKKGKIQDTLGNMEHNFVDSQRDFDLVKLNLTSLLSL
ncbi:MAG: EamA family transporter, partial [Proteobacteria bacterium]|nr:EamA family transporter [Pseudomonadota bacterium]